MAHPTLRPPWELALVSAMSQLITGQPRGSNNSPLKVSPGGCGGGNYCPTQLSLARKWPSAFLKGKNGASFAPPAVGASTGFTDVAADYWAAAFIKQLVADGIISGCGTGVYCPDSNVTRAQMAVF
ncbi:MAG: S-layer homology domain-containing protein [Anaerolineales bacterium]|nr:S-layer homology domain-containing protein [Anaerolineales bacterium]